MAAAKHMFSTSDDDAMMQQIQATHAPNGDEVDVKPFIHVIEDIIHCFTPPIPGLRLPPVSTSQAQLDALEDRTLQNGFTDSINKISCEIACKCSGGSDVDTTTLAVFNKLSSYSWEAKVVIALAAFAVNYGEFWLVAQLYPSNPLAKSVALLKQLPDMLERADSLKPKFKALINLIEAMLGVTNCIVQFKDLPSQCITAVYSTVRSIVECANLIGMGNKYIALTTEALDLSSLAQKVDDIHSNLLKQFALCNRQINENENINKAFQMLVCLFEMEHINNMKILKSLIYAKDDQLPLLDCSNKNRVSIDVLRRKNVLLLISDLDLSHEEYFILDQMYTESRRHPTRPEGQYEVVWLPVLDTTITWNDEKKQTFEAIQALMPWFSLDHPSLLGPAVIKYIKDVWHFNKKPLLVVLDQQGKVVNPNAIHMLRIWQSKAFPFTSLKEKELWKEKKCSIELLADFIDQSIVNWNVDKQSICLYGGENQRWIQDFIKTAQEVAKEANITLEMFYVGKSNSGENVGKISKTITDDKHSHKLPSTVISHFWVRLESMWHSRMQHNKPVENDRIMKEIMAILTFDESEQGWAVISDGKAEMAKAKGDTMLTSLAKYKEWKDRAKEVGFVKALIDNLQKRTPHHCNRLILPGTTGSMPEKVVCFECGHLMEKLIIYRCCRMSY